MHLNAFAHTDVGNKRGNNEDSHVCNPELGLFAVCDGMGGHAAGEVASALAVQTIESWIVQLRKTLDGKTDWDTVQAMVLDVVQKAVGAASQAVYRHATGTHGRAGMGTTCTVLLIVGHKGVMAHVGDSRLYLCRQNNLYLLTEDHNYLTEMEKTGVKITEKIKRTPHAQALTRAVGIQETVQVDTLVFDVFPDDTYLLCSDGLYSYFKENRELAQLLGDQRVASRAEHLVSLAKTRGGHDNITAVVLNIQSYDENHRARSSEVDHQLSTLRYVSLFKHLEMKELVQVLNMFDYRSCDPGETIIQQGAMGSSMYVNLEGRCAVVRDGKTLATLEPGTHFGEMALLNSRPRSASVVAIDEVRLLRLAQKDFTQLVMGTPQLGVKLLWTIGRVLCSRLDGKAG